MGGDLLRRKSLVQELLNRASDAVGEDLLGFICRGDAKLTRTEFAQPGLVAVCVGIAYSLQAAGHRADVVAGHSVGQMSAFCLAGCLEPEQAVDCAVSRGLAMARAAKEHPGGMIALKGAAEVQLHDALAIGRAVGLVDLAAHNAAAEWVLSGEVRALAAIAARFETVRLPVAGPWHSRAMAEAASEWRKALGDVTFHKPRLPLVCSVTGDVVDAGCDLRERLVLQLTQPVCWVDVMRTLRGFGVKTWDIIGPGRVLRGLCRQNIGLCDVAIHDGDVARRRAG